MNRRRAIQLVAAASFSSAFASGNVSGQSLMSPVAPEPENCEHLRILLQLVSNAAENCHRCSILAASLPSSVQQAIWDAHFYSTVAVRRLQHSREKSPAFWQTCLDRLQNSAATVKSFASRQSCWTELVSSLESCLPALKPVLDTSLA